MTLLIVKISIKFVEVEKSIYDEQLRKENEAALIEKACIKVSTGADQLISISNLAAMTMTELLSSYIWLKEISQDVIGEEIKLVSFLNYWAER